LAKRSSCFPIVGKAKFPPELRRDLRQDADRTLAQRRHQSNKKHQALFAREEKEFGVKLGQPADGWPTTELLARLRAP